MTTPDFHAVIMAGGSGTRFWPASRANRPKQFLPLAHGLSLLAATVARVRPLAGVERTWIVTNPAQAAALPAVLPGFAADHVIVEPQARDTAPCVALAAATIGARYPEAMLAVMPADHVIEPQERFTALLARGVQVAREHRVLVTFGITPKRPATSYGYIERGTPLDDGTPRASRVLRFREKPDAATAQQFVAAGNFVWNSGIFVWSLPELLAAMDAGAPELAAATRAMTQASQRGDTAAVHAAFASCPPRSIDFAVMERAPRVAVVDSDLRWSDVGSFTTLHAVSTPDREGNVGVLARGTQAVFHDAKDSVVYGEGARTVVLFGVHDLVVVAVDDAVLVCPTERADDLKQVVERLRASGRADLL
jgi:mannose-1-phosphate guanylyltransferase